MSCNSTASKHTSPINHKINSPHEHPVLPFLRHSITSGRAHNARHNPPIHPISYTFIHLWSDLYTNIHLLYTFCVKKPPPHILIQ
jgi:hypothetical protein